MANIQKSTEGTGLADVVERILDKGIVIDIWARVSLVGLEILAVEARIVIASVETYLRYAQAIGLSQGAAKPAERIEHRYEPTYEELIAKPGGMAAPHEEFVDLKGK